MDSKKHGQKAAGISHCRNTFTVDGRIYEFRETAAPWNQISMDHFWENESTHILFDKRTNNIYNGDAGERPDHVELVQNYA